ncbi:MAG: energy transducer TonB [Pseudomonadota bacterium]
MIRPVSIEQVAGLAIVLALHTATLWGLWQHRLIPSPQEAMTLFVNFIAPSVPEKIPPPPPKPKPIEKPQPRQLVAETPVVAPYDYLATSPLPKPEPIRPPVVEAPPMPMPVGPVALTSELSVACPERTPPAYPAFSRRMGEEGTVILRVELDEAGVVAHARVQTSSGFARLDEAALDAVRTWRCNPAQRNGQPVRAVAMQPFKFILQGN